MKKAPWFAALKTRARVAVFAFLMIAFIAGGTKWNNQKEYQAYAFMKDGKIAQIVKLTDAGLPEWWVWDPADTDGDDSGPFHRVTAFDDYQVILGSKPVVVTRYRPTERHY